MGDRDSDAQLRCVRTHCGRGATATRICAPPTVPCPPSPVPCRAGPARRIPTPPEERCNGRLPPGSGHWVYPTRSLTSVEVLASESIPIPARTVTVNERPHDERRCIARREPGFVVADLSQAEFGRKEMAIARPRCGLMAIREEFRATQPLKGARIAGSLHMTIRPRCSSRR